MDNFILIKGGLVRNNPDLPVIDLDILDSGYCELDEAVELLAGVDELLVDEPDDGDLLYCREQITNWIDYKKGPNS